MIDDFQSVAPKRVRRKPNRHVLSPEEETVLLNKYCYDPETGIVTWIKPGKKYGTQAGYSTGNGRITLSLSSRKTVLAYRFAFLFMTGKMPVNDVDHKDLDPLNDRWCNLRLATHQQNSRNKGLSSNSSSGMKGAHFHKKSGSWVAHITWNKRLVHLGTFDTALDAHSAYCSAAYFLHGEFVNLGNSPLLD